MEYIVSGSLLGEGTLIGVCERTFITSGQAIGSSAIRRYVQTAYAESFGLGELTGQSVLDKGLQGHVYGLNRFWASVPLPIIGTGRLVAYIDVEEPIKAPFGCRFSGPKAFRWGDLIQRGDVSIWFYQVDISGSYLSGDVRPFRVRYCLYQVLPGGSRLLIGSPNRTPVQGNVGEYYLTGHAGEGGQPGTWIVVWRYQPFFEDDIYEREQSFVVQDAVMAGVVCPCRVSKIGWF